MVEITSPEAAKCLGVTSETIRAYVQRGLLPGRRQGIRRKIYIELEDLIRFAAQYGYRLDLTSLRPGSDH